MRKTIENSDTLPGFETLDRPKVGTSSRGFSIPSAIWNRAALLFGALSLIKLTLMLGLRKHLFEIHWRITVEPVDWTSWVALYVFAVVAGLNLWIFATRCERGGVRVVRPANTYILALGALFILLTFHEGDNNHLSALMNDYLTPAQLKWYLIMNFCFREPYLVLWLLGYAFVYYGFLRSRREHLMLRVTAVFATAYIVLCLRDFAQHREGLITAACVGVAMLVGARQNTRSMSVFLAGIVAACMGFLFVLFYGLDGLLTWRGVNREFFVLAVGSVIVFAGMTALGWRRGFSASWSWLQPFAFTTFILFINTNYIQAQNYYNLLCSGWTLPRYFLGEAVVTLAWLGAAWVYRRCLPKGSLIGLDVLLLLVVAIGLIDFRLMQIMAVRLDWQVLSLAFGETTKMMWRMSLPYLPSLAVALAAMAGIYAGLLVIMRRTIDPANQSAGAKRGEGESLATGKSRAAAGSWVLVAFVSLGLAGHWLMESDKAKGQALTLLTTTSPWWQRTANPVMDADTFNKTARRLGIWQPAEGSATGSTVRPVDSPPASGSARNMNVVVIFQESTYNKYLSMFSGKEETQPLLSRYKDRMELFPNFFSSFAGSINARFATFTGLYPVKNFGDFTTHRVPVKSMFEILHSNGYSNSLFYSSYFDYTGFRDFLRGRDIEEMHDADTMPGERKTRAVSWGLHEEETLGAIREQIKEYATNRQKFFLTYIPAAPHNPFDGTPARFVKHEREKLGDFTPQYLNEMLYMDWVVTSIVDQLNESGLLDHTLVVITGDHGEMLGQNGGPIGHGWMLTPELANVPLIIMNPSRPGYRVNETVGSQVDLLPTVLDLLGIPVPPGELYQGTSLYSSSAGSNRTIYLNTFRQYGIIDSGVLSFRDRERGGGSGVPIGVFSITNQGAQTVFKPVEPPSALTNSAVTMSDFDKFQENFLRNYSDYSRMIQAGK